MAATYGTYTWSRYSGAAPTVPLVPPIDPQHSTPANDPNLPPGQQPDFVSTAPAPMYPDTEGEQQPAVGGGGPIDQTPLDPDYGVGWGPALTQQQASEIATELGNRDFGEIAARQTLPLTSRADGSGPHVEWIPDEIGDGDSPQSLQLQRTGVGQPNDPYARRAERQRRWWDRIIDMHWFNPQMRPITPKVAFGAQPQPPVPGGTSIDSPFPTSVTFNPVTKDQFVVPQDRRVPDPWDLAMTIDGQGAAQPPFFEPDYGF